MGAGTIDFAKYMLFTFPMSIVLIIAYVLICKFIFRANVSQVTLDSKDLIATAQPLTKQQKWSLALIVGIVLINCIPSILPADFFLSKMISSLGLTGRFALLLIITMLIHVDGKPLMDVRTMAAKGVMWEAIYISAFILPISTLMMSADTGITPFLISVFTPILGGRSVIVFVMLIVIIATILTNLANNTVTAIVFMSIAVPFASQMGINPIPIAVIIILTTQMACATPAATPFAPLLFANTTWLKPKDIYFYGGISMLLWGVVMATIGYCYLNLIFH